VDTTTEFSTNDEVRIPKRRCLVAILITYVLYGFLGGMLPEDSIILGFFGIAVPIFTSLMVVLWSHLDSEQWAFTISKRLSIMLFLLWIIALPYYLSINRKGSVYLKALGQAVLFILLTVCASCIAYAIGYLIYYVIYE